MPMPHRTQMQVIKRRLVGKEGSERIRELRRPRRAAGLPEWPVRGHPQVGQRPARGDADPREGRAPRLDRRPARGRGADRVRRAAERGQVVAPTGAVEHPDQDGRLRLHDARPVPALTRIRGVLVQLVEIPGLIAGAGEDRGGGRALLGVLRGADAIVYCQGASAPAGEIERDGGRSPPPGSTRPASSPRPRWTRRTRRRSRACAGWGWRSSRCRCSMTPASSASVPSSGGSPGLIRVFLRKHGEDVSEAVALHPPATVADAARSIHHQLEERCLGAHVWGPSARFDGQRVGREHELADDDVIEVIALR